MLAFVKKEIEETKNVKNKYFVNATNMATKFCRDFKNRLKSTVLIENLGTFLSSGNIILGFCFNACNLHNCCRLSTNKQQASSKKSYTRSHLTFL